MVRVLNIIGNRPHGGVGSFVLNYQKHMNSELLKIDYLLFDDENTGAFDEIVKAMGSEVYLLPGLKNRRLFFLKRLVDCFFANNRFDIIHLHTPNIAFFVFPSARKYGMKNLLVHSHATMYSDKKLNAIRNRLLCFNLKKISSHYLACSIAAGDFLFGRENRDKVVVLNNAIDCEKYAYNQTIREKKRAEIGLANEFVIGHAGIFNEQKNHSFLIDIFENVKKIRKDSVLLLAGEGPLLGKIKQKVLDRNLEKSVIFLGYRKDVNELLMAMDVLVMPSLYEGLPLIGVEAQATGLNCVFSDTITREIDVGSALFVRLNKSAEEWGKTIVEIDCKKNRENAYRHLASAGYDIKKEAKKLEDLYLSIGKNNNREIDD